MTIDIQLLQKIPFFDSLSITTVEKIAGYCYTSTFIKGEVIQVAGEKCQWVAFIQKGAVSIFRSAMDGREQILQTLGPGMYFNAIPGLNGLGIVRASVRAITPVTLLLIPIEEFRELLRTRADLAFVLVNDLAKRLDNMTDLIEDLSLRSVRGRLARFLLDQADNGKDFEHWTQDEIAARLGTVRDVVGRTLRGFIGRGLLRRENGKLLLVDREKLEEESNN
jgi:CRP/FNR family transcriptional regulator